MLNPCFEEVGYPRMLCGVRTMPNEVEQVYRKDVKACPFCGKPPVIQTAGKGRFLMILCITDGCTNPAVSYLGDQEAVHMWNQRAG
jgi:hypothetical protein